MNPSSVGIVRIGIVIAGNVSAEMRMMKIVREIWENRKG